MTTPPTTPRVPWTFDHHINSEIRRAAQTGIYDIRGGGAKRRVPHFDDLLFLGASMSRYHKLLLFSQRNVITDSNFCFTQVAFMTGLTIFITVP